MMLERRIQPKTLAFTGDRLLLNFATRDDGFVKLDELLVTRKFGASGVARGMA